MKRPILRCLMVLAAIAAVVSACGSASALSSQSTNMTLGSNPVRSYILYKPAHLKAGAPLLIVLHGGGSTDSAMEGLSQFDPVADAHGFLVAYPDAMDPGVFGRDTGWQLGCCDTYNRATTDFHFFSSLVSHLAQTEHIDTHRVYMVGFSLGAAMTYRVACQTSSLLAGMASVGGFEYVSKPCKPSNPLAVYEIHGTNDYFGGSCGGKTQTDAGCGLGDPGYEPSVVQTNAQWRRIDGCSSAVQTTRSGSVYRRLWANCSGSSRVQLDEITGGSHCWPHLPAAGRSACGNYNASNDIWLFLSHSSLNG